MFSGQFHATWLEFLQVSDSSQIHFFNAYLFIVSMHEEHSIDKQYNCELFRKQSILSIILNVTQ